MNLALECFSVIGESDVRIIVYLLRHYHSWCNLWFNKRFHTYLGLTIRASYNRDLPRLHFARIVVPELYLLRQMIVLVDHLHRAFIHNQSRLAPRPVVKRAAPPRARVLQVVLKMKHKVV